MESIKEIYRIGNGPSSSHTIGPGLAAKKFIRLYPQAVSVKTHLYGSLASTGRGHMTDTAIEKNLNGLKTEIIWHPEENLPEHPNGIKFDGFDNNHHLIGTWQG